MKIDESFDIMPIRRIHISCELAMAKVLIMMETKS